MKRSTQSRDRATARSLIARLGRDAQHIAWRFGLRYRSIEAERAGVTSRYGICYDDGAIRIRLHHAVTGRPLKYSSLVSTLCHELAHLRYFNHGVRFRAFNQELLEFARAQGIYRPRRSSAVGDAPAVIEPVPLHSAREPMLERKPREAAEGGDSREPMHERKPREAAEGGDSREPTHERKPRDAAEGGGDRRQQRPVQLALF